MPDLIPTPPHLGRPPWPVLLVLVGGALLLHLGVIDRLASSATPRDAAPLETSGETMRMSAIQIRTVPPERLRTPEAAVTVSVPQSPEPPPASEAAKAGIAAEATPKVFVPPRAVADDLKKAAPLPAPPMNRLGGAPQSADSLVASATPGLGMTSALLASAPLSASAVSAVPLNVLAGSTAAVNLSEPTDLAVAAVPALRPVSSGWAGEEGDPPTYRTALPAPFTLNYSLGRGLMTGSGELSWRLLDGRYELRLSGRLAGLTLLNQVSSGGIDPAGIAPLRFTDKRLRGGVQAANFQRSADGRSGKITFSGPSVTYPLRAGVQDRLSWMVQLPAIVQAEPQRLAEGQLISIPVVGARGDADIWVFRFRAWDVVQTPAGAVRAARFSREPRGPYDTQVEVWLDPALHHLPVRARLTHAPDGDTLELLRL